MHQSEFYQIFKNEFYHVTKYNDIDSALGVFKWSIEKMRSLNDIWIEFCEICDKCEVVEIVFFSIANKVLWMYFCSWINN